MAHATSIDCDLVQLTPITAADLSFLLAVYASTREEELAQTGWSQQKKQIFLQMQFNAQHQHYQTYYPEGNFDLISVNGVNAGRLYSEVWPTQIRIIDIALLPQYRGNGVGSLLLRNLLKAAKLKHLEVSIHVEVNNRAMAWYKKNGFVEIEDKGIYKLLKTEVFTAVDY